jgi:hypothetical protein
MTRFLGSAECLSLIDLVLTEAESDTGTWSLSSYLKIRSLVPRFASSDMATFIKSVMNVAIGPDAKSQTRYKLAQILSAMHALGIPEFEHALRNYYPEIEDSCEKIIDSGELGKPTVKLLKSLEAERHLGAAADDVHLRRVSATPSYSPSAGLGVPRVSRSPVPAPVLRRERASEPLFAHE